MRRRTVLGLVTLVVIALAVPIAARAQNLRVGSELQVNQYTVQNQTLPVVASAANGDAVITWSSEGQDGNSSSVFARRFTSSGAAPSEFQVNVITAGSQRLPWVASSAGGAFVITWQAFDGGNVGVFARRFASNATPLGGEFQVNTYTASYQRYATVAADSAGNFVVVWQSYSQDGQTEGVFGRRFSSSGAPQTGEFLVSTYTLGDQLYPRVANGSNGDFVVAWQRFDGSNYGVFARRFSSAGAPLGGEFLVNVTTVENQRYAALGIDPGGGFVVTWQANIFGDGSGEAVMARRFTSAGAAIGNEFVANTHVADSQYRPSIGVEPDGEFVIVWQSHVQDDNTNGGVFGRLFTADAIPVNVEFQVNAYTTSTQNRPSVAVGGGRFVVTWQSYFQDGDMVGAFAQRFASPIPLDVDGNFIVEPLTDGLLALRYAFGFRGATLVTGAVGANCTRCDAASIEAYLFDLAN